MSVHTRLHPLEFRVYKSLLELKNLQPCSNYIFVLCISGGRDSMSLLSIFNNILQNPLLKNLGSMQLHVVHFNHAKRGIESNLDEELVKNTCATLNLSYTSHRFNSNEHTNDNFHKVAREWRYYHSHLLRQQLHQNLPAPNCSWVVTAHHAQDHMETVLLNLIRGTGLSGLEGIHKISVAEHLFRPMINITSAEIDTYVNDKKILFRTDSSNLSDNYSRNFLRNQVLPLLKQLNPSIETAVLRMSENIKQQANCTDFEQQNFLPLTKNITPADIMMHAKKISPLLIETLSANMLQNLHHHAILSLGNKKISYRINLKKGWIASIIGKKLIFSTTDILTLS